MSLKQIFEQAKLDKRNSLTEIESKKLLEMYKIPVVNTELVNTLEGSLEFAEKFGYPLVLKIVSPQIIHKTEVGGVILDISNEKELREGYYKLIKSVEKNRPNVKIHGISVQKMVKNAYEVLVGSKLDPTFGHVVVFGMGGIFVEIFKDISFRIVPVNRNDAEEMVTEVKASNILKGFRNKPPANIKSLVDIILKTSKLVEENKQIKEIDINPVFALPKTAVAGDARVILV